MFWTNVKRIVSAGFVSVFRHGFISLTAVLMLVAPLFMLASLIFNNHLLDQELTNIQDRVDINVYFMPSSGDDAIFDAVEKIKNLPEVSFVEYQPKDEVLAAFRERHRDDQSTLQALDELADNPFGATLSIKAKAISEYEGIAQFLSDYKSSELGRGVIDSVNYYQNKTTIDRLKDIIKESRSQKLLQTVFLALIALLVIFNTIRLAIYSAREEISVKRLVGASNSYIQGPFIVEGIVYGVMASVALLVLLFPITYWFSGLFNPFPSLSGIYQVAVFDYYVGNFFFISFTMIGTSVVLAALSSFLAVRKYLSV